MAKQVTVHKFEKVGRKFILWFLDTSSMEWPDQDILEQYIDDGPSKGDDDLVRGLLRRIRNSDPTFANISNITDVVYEQPDIREVP